MSNEVSKIFGKFISMKPRFLKIVVTKVNHNLSFVIVFAKLQDRYNLAGIFYEQK